MPFNNWDIPARLFNIKPVGKDTLSNFIGRSQLVAKLRRQIALKNIRFIFEGE